MKCCIFTLIGVVEGSDNYGAELQNYAVQKILKKNGQLAETFFEKSKIERNFLTLKHSIFDIVKMLLGKSYGKYLIRQMRFEDFRKKYIKISKYSNKDINTLNAVYDFFLVGSDQVWNPLYNSFDYKMMLSFADNNKKIAFCASIGLEEIPKEKMDIFKENIPLFKGISVREKQAACILQKFTHQDIVTLCDPTLMIKKDEWNKISLKPKNHGYKRYILVYFLGNMSTAIRNELNKFRNQYDCDIVDISPYFSCRFNKRDSSYYGTGPLEFIWLIFNANLICTDSFHGFAFACIGGKRVIVFKREDSLNMEGRIKGLANELGFDLEYGKPMNIDSAIVEKYQKQKLAEANDFLKKSIKE